MREIGLIGLGNAGRPLGERLLSKGYPLKVYDINHEAAEPLIRLGAQMAGSAEEAATETTITILPSSVEVKAAVLGPRGVLSRIRDGFTLIDLSGTDPQCARELEQGIKERGEGYTSGPHGRIGFEDLSSLYRNRGEELRPRIPAHHARGSLWKILRKPNRH